MFNMSNKFGNDLKKIESKQSKVFYKQVNSIMNDIIRDAIINLMLKGHFNTKKMQESFYFKQKSGNSFVVGNSHEYAIFLECGTEPHVIRAVNKPYLVFETKEFQNWNNLFKTPVIGRGGGFMKKTKSVKHPGVEAMWFLKKAIQDNIKKKK